MTDVTTYFKPAPTENPPRRRLSRYGRRARREADALAAFRAAVHARTYCEANTPACQPGQHVGYHAHHICPADRSRGQHLPERGLLVCGPGHAHIHAHPERSYIEGWLLRDDGGPT